MNTTWDFAYLLPHAAFQEPIENDHLALVPPGDRRLLALSRKYKTVRKLTSRFKDQFGEKIEPSALLIRADAPASARDFYAVVSFRNIVAISSLIDSWVFRLAGGSVGYPLWSDYFDFYPFSPQDDYEDLAARSAANREIQKPDKFSGQRAPHLPTSKWLSFDTDKFVLKACLYQWERRFIKGYQESKTTKLFRSLQVATQASRMPAVGTRVATIHDAGVSVSLWVSAFEILCRPKGANVDLLTVLTLLDDVEYLERSLQANWYQHQNKNGVLIRRINYVQKLYVELYRARCDFLHGNPVTSGNLFPSKDRKGPILLYCAPLVYRAALSAFLPDTNANSKDIRSLPEQAASFVERRLAVGKFEDVLLACQQKKKKK